MSNRDKRIKIFGDERDNDIESKNALLIIGNPNWADGLLANKICELCEHYQIKMDDAAEALADLAFRLARDCVRGFRVKQGPRVGRKLRNSFDAQVALAAGIDAILKSQPTFSLKVACCEYQSKHDEQGRWKGKQLRTIENQYHAGKINQAKLAEYEELIRKEGDLPPLMALGRRYRVLFCKQ